MKPRLTLLAASIGIALAAGGAGAQNAQPTKRPSDEVRGTDLYKRHCEACHGAWAKGHGPATQALVRPVPDLEGRVVADDRTIQIVMRGRGSMPGYEQAFDRFDAKRVLEHMAKVRKPTADTAPAPAAAQPGPTNQTAPPPPAQTPPVTAPVAAPAPAAPAPQ